VQLDAGVDWWLGDWWIGHQQQYGARAAICKAEGWSLKTCSNHGTVSRAFAETSRRRELLDWSHHEVVSRLDPAKADQFLDWAIEPLARGRCRRSTRDLVAAVHCSRVTLGEQVSDETCSLVDLNQLIAKGRTFGSIFADPPWRHLNTVTYGAASLEYETMTNFDIEAMPISKLAAPDAHLHIWVVPAVLWAVKAIVEAWGFNPNPPHPFVWCKEGHRLGMGNGWRTQHETMFTFMRGQAKYFNDKSIPSVLLAPRGAHSQKPDEVRRLIERVSPGPYLELFGRKPVTGWKVWGNQIGRSVFHGACGPMALDGGMD
jgi:N6-adenosine-specific RNA methylase IME4